MNIGSTHLEVIFVVDVCVLVQRPIVAEPQHLGEDVLLPQLAAHPEWRLSQPIQNFEHVFWEEHSSNIKTTPCTC